MAFLISVFTVLDDEKQHIYIPNSTYKGVHGQEELFNAVGTLSLIFQQTW